MNHCKELTHIQNKFNKEIEEMYIEVIKDQVFYINGRESKNVLAYHIEGGKVIVVQRKQV